MISSRCAQRLARRDAASTLATQSRTFRQLAPQRAQAVTAQTTTANNPRPHGKPAATATPAVAQPFSTPLSYAPENLDLPINTKQSTKPAMIQSSVPAGTVLKGLNFMKNKQDPVALEDHEYPAWLWDVLNDKGDVAGSKDNDDKGDLFSKSKKQRRIAAKALRRQQLLSPESLAPKIPLYEQSIDLPSGDGSLQGVRAAKDARQDLTAAMRQKRRSKIKEDNFLKEMR